MSPAKRQSQKVERIAPMTAAGTRIRQRDQANEWIAYSLVIAITIMLGVLLEDLYDRWQGIARDKPPELVAALEMQKSGGRLAENPLTGVPRAADDPARERDLLARIKANPEDAEALKELGHYYYDTLWIEKAVETYNQYLALEPDDVGVMTDLATMMMAQGNAEAARGVLPKDMDPNTGPVAGVALLREAVEVDPNFAPAWQNLGWAYAQIGRTEEAVSSYEKAILNTTDPEARAGMERIVAQLKGEQQAPVGAPGTSDKINPLTGQPIPPPDPEIETRLKRAVATNPTDPGPHLTLGHYYYDIYEPALAVAEYETYLELGGTATAEVRTDYATVLSRLDQAGAITKLEEVTRDFPNFLVAWVNLGYLRIDAGDSAGALVAFKTALPLSDERTRPALQTMIAQLEGVPGN